MKINAEARLQAAEVSGPVEMRFGDEDAHPTLKAKSPKALDNILFGSKSQAFRQQYRPSSYMRVGHYSVVITQDGDVGAARLYTDTLIEMSDIKPGSRFWDSSKKDRTSQIKMVSQALKSWPQHPMGSELKKDMKAELDYYKAN
jgi:hypothetical protein